MDTLLMRRIGYGTVTILLLLLVLAWTVSIAAPPRPIPAGASAMTSSTLDAQLVSYHQRVIVEAYNSNGMRNRVWDEDAVRYLDDYIRAINRLPGAPTFAALVPRGAILVEIGCNDPQVLYVYGTALHQVERYEDAETILRRAVTGFAAGAAPRSRARLAPRRLLEICEVTGGGKPEERARWQELAIQWTAEALTDGSFQPGESRLALIELEKNWTPFYSERFSQLTAALAALPRADSYVVNMLKGRDAAARAWAARGNAQKPSHEEQQLFIARMAVARTCFTEAWKLHPAYPEAATAMIPLAMAGAAGNLGTPRLWFDRAVSAQLDYLPAYAAYRKALQPHWGGSADALYAFGLECVRTRRFDTDVPLELVQALRDIEIVTGARTYWRKTDAYLAMKALCEGYAKSRPGDAAWYRTLCAAVAWYGGNYPEARRLLNALGNKAQAGVFARYFDARYERVRPEIYALSSPAAKKIALARDLEARNQAEALKAYEAALTGLTDTQAKLYVQQRLRELRAQARLAAGEWVNITPDATFIGWRRVAGMWSVGKDGTLKGMSGRDGLLLICDREFGEQVDIRGEIVFLRSPYTQFNAAVMVSAPRDGGDYRSVTLFAREQRVLLRRGFTDTGATELTAPVKDVNTVLIQARRGVLTITINDVVVAKDVPLAGGAGPCIGVGGQYWYAGAEVAFRRLQARRVP
ncbi:MAG: hypothetical protein BWY76_01448 [bacterium ADurb.Bin429]|nr:MAG: hypothetical protein BWY76_01448 [bacterium ADurb.Bin429]